MQYVLVADVGTTGVKAFLFDEKCNQIGKSYQRISKTYPHTNWVEQSPEELVEKTIHVLRTVIRDAGISTEDIVCCGITTQRETIIAWDKHSGKAIYPAIVWQDTRTQETCGLLQSTHESYIQKSTGLSLIPYFSASKIQWILQNSAAAERPIKKNTLACGTVDSWILWNLTGRPATHYTDYTNASRTLLLNIQTKTWDTALLNLFSIPASILPQLRPSQSSFGSLQADILGKEVPILILNGDQQSSLYAAGTTVGTTKVTFGTGTFLMQLIGNTFALHPPFFTTIAASGDYAIEAKIAESGQQVERLLKTPQLLNPYFHTLAQQVYRYIAQLPFTPTKITIDGGITQNPSLLPILKDEWGIPIYQQPTYDATALGVAKQLWNSVSSGGIEPPSRR